MEVSENKKYVEIIPGIKITIGSKILYLYSKYRYIGEVIDMFDNKIIVIKDICGNIVAINTTSIKNKIITILPEETYEWLKTKHSKKCKSTKQG